MPEPMITETEDWANFTPQECTYDLLMSDPGGSGIQQIELTRDESGWVDCANPVEARKFPKLPR